MHHVAAYALDKTTTVGTEAQLFLFFIMVVAAA
jgi:hypothetical protein